MFQQYPSALLERAVGEFAKLPGIGRKTALRLVLHLLRQPEDDVRGFADAVYRMRREVKFCHVCHNISDTDTCEICADKRRDASTICVVENIQDVMAVENTQQFNGDSLVKRVAEGGVKEVILALGSTMEGDTTNFYISRKLESYPVTLSLIARGISVGNELEYTDEVTLGRSILNRIPFGKQ